MKPTLSDKKLRGGYYTPPIIAAFLAKWAIRSSGDHVLEPSCGDGNLLVAASATLRERGATYPNIARLLHGVEFDKEEACKATKRLEDAGIPKAANQIHNGDFFAYCQSCLFDERLLNTVTRSGRSFDAIIGNPPFIRYQNFPETQRTIACELMRGAGLHPNRLTNSWVPFLIASTLLLKDSGRLAMVIPAELFQVSYAAEIRLFLSNFYHQITILTFRKLVFKDIQQEIVLILCEREKKGEAGIRVIELEDCHALKNWETSSVLESDVKPLDHTREKWTQYFLDQSEIELLRTLRCHPKVVRSGSVIDVDVGIVTGENSFFVLSEEKVSQKEIGDLTHPVVTRSNHLEGAVFTETDWCENVKKQYPTFLFRPADIDAKELPISVQSFLQEGEEAGINTGYKCRIRKRWYVVPSIWTPDAFMLRQVHSYPKLILNHSGATCTDTIHRVRFRDNANCKNVVAAFLNSLTFAFSEVTGRSYGGGVLTFEPSEAEDLPIPLAMAERLDINHLDALLRAKEIEKVLDITDKTLLCEGLGLTQKEASILRGIWAKMRSRRIYRKR
ncbi:MAG: class I SAM-dependent methyltransferase [Armatimonadetes bacterium]|nr:class I SAM-dependent methyltransferase [Armatimonadota bacterium]